MVVSSYEVKTQRERRLAEDYIVLDLSFVVIGTRNQASPQNGHSENLWSISTSSVASCPASGKMGFIYLQEAFGFYSASPLALKTGLRRKLSSGT
jgi:hypothetical protein